MFDVGQYTLSPHRVVWRDQAADFAAAVVPLAVPSVLPNHKAMMVACGSEDEAHYLSGVVNSLPVRTFVASYVVETQISTHLVRYVHIPRFDSGDPRHCKLRDASRSAHEAVAHGNAPDEGAVDLAAAALWGLEHDEINAMRRYLERLRKRHRLETPKAEPSDDEEWSPPEKDP